MTENTCYKKILVIKLWAIGEIALCTPCISKLKNKFPEADIYFLVGNNAKDIIINNPYIEKVIPVDENIFLKRNVIKSISLIKKLRREKFDMVIVLHHSTPFSLFAFLIGAPKRLGLQRPGSRSFYTDSIVSTGANRHRSFEYLSILELLGISVEEKNARIRIYPTDADKRKILHLMKENRLEPKKFMILSPTGGKNPAATAFNSNIKNKVWPPENYRRLCELIIKKLNFTVVIIGANAEKEHARYIKNKNDDRVIDLTNKTNLRQLAFLGEQASLIVTNDSGPTFMISSSGTPTIVIFGPTDADLTRPLSDNITIMREKLDCSPCHDPSRFPNIIKDCESALCMKRITPEKVFTKICDILNSKRTINESHFFKSAL